MQLLHDEGRSLDFFTQTPFKLLKVPILKRTIEELKAGSWCFCFRAVTVKVLDPSVQMVVEHQVSEHRCCLNPSATGKPKQCCTSLPYEGSKARASV